MVVSDGCGVEELEDFRRKIELEAEERKLEETLEFQRRLENEAKQKLLAEQRRRNALAASEGGLEESAGAPLKAGIAVAVHNNVRSPISWVSCYLEIFFILVVLPRIFIDGYMVR